MVRVPSLPCVCRWCALLLATGVVVAADDLVAEVLAAPPVRREAILAGHFAPTPMHWPTQGTTLREVLATLSSAAPGSEVLLELGVDASTPVELAAGSGTWWDGAAALCAAAGLIPAAPAPRRNNQSSGHNQVREHLLIRRRLVIGGGIFQDSGEETGPSDPMPQLEGGPLRLRLRNAADPLLLPAGSVLLEIAGRRLLHYRSGMVRRRMVEFDVYCRLEPGKRVDLVEAADLVWERFATVTGTPVQAAVPAPGSVLEQALLDVLEPGRLRLGDLPDDCRALRLEGRLNLRCAQRLPIVVRLEAGREQQVPGLPFPFSCSIGPAAQADGDTMPLSIRYVCDELAGNPDPQITTAAGRQVEITARSSGRGADGASELNVTVRTAPGEGPWTLGCSLALALPSVALPVVCEVPLP